MNEILNILLPVIIFVVLGGLIGIILAIASIKMAVPKDKKVEKIRNALPGANCGVCSYSGCDGYAQALVNEGAKPNLCVPGGEESLKRIADILNISLVGDVIKQTALIRCGGCSEFTSKKLEYKGMETCFAAAQFYGGTWRCDYGCLGFGDCANVCEYDAIKIENGLSRIDPSLCRGCGACIAICPKGLIESAPSKARGVVRCSCKNKGGVVRKICKVGCIGCGRCLKACPHQAISLSENLANVNAERCVGCGACVKVCPTHCISIFGFHTDSDVKAED